MPKVPYSDPSLVRDPVEYAAFIARLVRCGVCSIGGYSTQRVGLFFVRKKNGKLRLIPDTRILNAWFRRPAYTQLPTASAWAGVRLRKGCSLVLGHTDVDNALYRFRRPPGISELFTMPSVDAALLRSHLGKDFCSDIAGKRLTPRLEVLAMGWSWSLYFCQMSVCACMEAAGYEPEDMLLD